MSLYSPATYDSFHPKYTRVQCSNGGRKRVQSARRDKWGRLLPNDDSVSLPKPDRHGQAGGRARAATAKRINGKFARKD